MGTEIFTDRQRQVQTGRHIETQTDTGTWTDIDRYRVMGTNTLTDGQIQAQTGKHINI